MAKGEQPNEPTSFGLAARRLREHTTTTAIDMSREFGVSPARLSQIELGIRNVSADMCQRYINFFERRGYEVANTLWEARAKSLRVPTYTIKNVDQMEDYKRELVLFFGDRLEDLTEKDCRIILQQMKERSERNRNKEE